MRSTSSRSAVSVVRLRTGALAAVAALGVTVSVQASAAPKEVVLASPAAALAYCQAGNVLAGDIAYIAGAGGLAQFGPDTQCAQQVPVKTKVKTTLYVKGKHTAECKMVGAAEALKFCQSGAMGEYDIAYIAGKVGQTLSGPGYGCIVNFSNVSLGNAICR